MKFMKCRFKFNRLVKATTLVAFLFGFLALASPCKFYHRENIHSEVVCSNNIRNTVRTYKNANRQIEINTHRLVNVGSDGWATFEFSLFDVAGTLDDDRDISTYYETSCKLNIDYNFNSNTFNQNCFVYFYFFDENEEIDLEHEFSTQYIVNNALSCKLSVINDRLSFIFTNNANYSWTPSIDYVTNFPMANYEYQGFLHYNTIINEVNNINQILTSKDKGLFDNANIQYGVYDMDNNTFIGPSPSSNIIDLNGGYTTSSTSWGTYENYISDNTQYSLANVVDFGNGKDISPYKYLFTIGPNESNSFLFGQSLHLYFKNGYVYTINGADIEYGQSAFDIASITNLSGSYILNKIVFTGNNGDYIPFGLSTSTDYTSGYDIGYKYGYENGVESGYNNGYLEGKNDVNEERYQAGYNKGYDDATNRYSDGSLSLTGVLNAIVTAPSKIIKEGLDFDILGFNVGKLVMSLIVIGLVVWAVGFFKKG